MSANAFVTSAVGQCIVCFCATDTGLAFRGDLDYQTAALVKLGVPFREAVATITVFPPDLDQDGIAFHFVRVCSDCARKAGLTEPVLIIPGADVPCYHQREAIA